jgi:hypothetical protein
VPGAAAPQWGWCCDLQESLAKLRLVHVNVQALAGYAAAVS